MGSFIVRRLIQGVFTLFGVMLLTFVLFRLVAGDVTFQFVNPKLGKEARINWLRKNQLDIPLVFNVQRRMEIVDRTRGDKPLSVHDAPGSKVVAAMVLEPAADADGGEAGSLDTLVTQPAQLMTEKTPLSELTGNDPWSVLGQESRSEEGSQEEETEKPAASQPETQPTSQAATPPSQPAEGQLNTPPPPRLFFTLRDGSELTVDLSELSAAHGQMASPAASATCGDFMRLIREHPDNHGRLDIRISDLDWGGVFNSQFFWHLRHSVTFRNRSFKTHERLIDIIKNKARFSLAITVPTMALGWLAAMVIAALVAYYRGSLIDKVGVFISVLGMCVPYLIYMIVIQKLVFEVAPSAAWGIHNPFNIYVPVTIAVVAGLGGSVRFYRTVILDEVNRDYVRTARAKGVPLYGILFRHVLKNCMLPILTSLVVSIPFLILGSLLLEQFFGIPGLGSLMITSVSDRDVPIISGLTFLTALVFIIGLLITDVLYAVFDPRIRLR